MDDSAEDKDKDTATLVPGPDGRMMTPSALKKELKRIAKLEKFKAKESAAAAKKAAAATASTATPSSDASTPARSSTPDASMEAAVQAAIDTPAGAKKDVSGPMPSGYNPRYVEAAWYAWWEQSGLFKPRLPQPGDAEHPGTFVIPIPPPNVTGSLHLGHALTNAIQDTLIRWHRMRGFTTLYLPGCDHAGIATQSVVEKRLWKSSKQTRHDLGRDQFIERVWQWKHEYGDRIYNQLRRLGSSYDWSRVMFTMDPNFVTAVSEAFVRLHDERIIYRDMRLVNWCCKLNTALSNLEVDSRELEGRTMLSVPGHSDKKKYEFGVIISFAYQLEDDATPAGRLVVATTRLETMLGDTAIAVHPQDDRYRHLVGKFVVHPFNGRRIPIIADDMVDREFGTGAVKITPAHDPNDYAVGKRHNLEFINILNDDGSINENGGAQFAGMMRFDARVAVLQALKERGLYIETKPNKMAIPICSRSGDVIEPMLKPQWWLNCQDMAAEAMKAVRDGELTIQPSLSEREWFKWLENIQDWCISRQLWWGHTIPAYLVHIDGADAAAADPADDKCWVAGRTREEAMQKARERHPTVDPARIRLEQDPDVLDTWFSAALWPFASFGWPNATDDLAHFYPNTVLETGWDILFFWVARMVMMGKKLTGSIPFKEIFCHAMVRDAHGRKMSKGLGNVIDPIDVIEGAPLEALHKQLEQGNLDPREVEKAQEGQRKDYPSGIPECGTDALRFALCAYQGTNRDINLDIMRVEGYRKFCNKLWNATKFAMMKLGEEFVPAKSAPVSSSSTTQSLTERWILHRLNAAIVETNAALTERNFMTATSAVYRFWLNELCDVYIEAIKPTVDGDGDAAAKESARQTLYTCLDTALRLLHPFMPFITEELYQRLPRRQGDAQNDEKQCTSIMIAAYPVPVTDWNNSEVERDFEFLNQIVKAARSLMADYGIKANATLYCAATSDRTYQLVSTQQDTVRTLVFCKNAQFSALNAATDAVPPGCALATVSDDCSLYLLVRGMVDIDGEVEKLRAKVDKSVAARTSCLKKCELPDYERKVRQDVREANAAKIKALDAEVEALEKAIANFLQLK